MKARRINKIITETLVSAMFLPLFLEPMGSCSAKCLGGAPPS